MSVIFAAVLLMFLITETAFCEGLPTIAIEETVRQASYVVRGKVLDGDKVEVLERYKGSVPDDVLSVPDILDFQQQVFKQLMMDAHPAAVLEDAGISKRNLQRMREAPATGARS